MGSTGHEQQPVGEDAADELGQAFDLLAQGVSGARGEQLSMGLPELEEQLNLPAQPGQDEGLLGRQARQVGQVNRPAEQGEGLWGERLLLVSGVRLAVRHTLSEGLGRQRDGHQVGA